MNICVYCAASVRLSQDYLDDAYELGKRIAERGHGLVFGAGQCGIMGAVANGVKEHGGHIIGATPRFFEPEGVVYYECDDLHWTETMNERKEYMEQHADAFVIAPGGMGTMEEFYEVLTAKQLGLHTKAICIYNKNGFYDKLIEFMDQAIEQEFIPENCHNLMYVTGDKEELLDYIENYVPHRTAIREMKFVAGTEKE